MNWHEETAAHGRSMTKAEYDKELGGMASIGVNLIRNSVYTRHPYVYDWADRNGMMVLDDCDNMCTTRRDSAAVAELRTAGIELLGTPGPTWQHFRGPDCNVHELVTTPR